MFDIPVVLFVFKRRDTVIRILERISKIKPRRLYILSDEGRNKEEKQLVKDVRETVETLIDWECAVIRNYATENRGVYGNIGLGAKWVLKREESAIFLEDDNLPEITFFRFCEILLDKYKDEERVLWICGTNYMSKYVNEDNDSYMFTQNLLPCGWASWADKFLKYYDSEFDTLRSESDIKNIKKNYSNHALYQQQYYSIGGELYRKNIGEEYRSWDYHMAYSIRYYDLLGISPCYNQIKNIGVDEMSEHGGASMSMVMTRRFCGMDSFPLEFPLRHPSKIEVDRTYENQIDRIILMPLSLRVRGFLVRMVKGLLGISKYQPIRRHRS